MRGLRGLGIQGLVNPVFGAGCPGGVFFLDNYLTDLAAGSVNGTQAEPGGSATTTQKTRNVVDTAGSKLSIASGIGTIASGTGAGDPRIYYGPFTRVPGLIAKQFFRVSNRGGCGWSTVTNSAIVNSGFTDAAGVHTVVGAAHAMFSINTDYTVWIVLFASGGAIFIQGGAYTNATLLWIYRATTSDMYYYSGLARTAGCGMTFDNVEITTMATLGSELLLSTVYTSNPANGVNYIGNANAIHRLTFTRPAIPANGNIIELRYRYQDATNYWTAYIIYNGGTSQWDFYLDKVVAGVAANQITVANVGTVTDLLVIVDGNIHDTYSVNSTTYTKRGATVTDAAFATETEVGAWFNAGAVSLITSAPRAWTL